MADDTQTQGQLPTSRSVARRRRFEPGAFCWVGLATSDPAAAKAFYASQFGWQSADLPAGKFGAYASLRRVGKEVAILYRQTREARAARAAPHWTPYISVEDADASALQAQQLGGAVLRDPHDLADAGRVAALRDPVGAILSLWQPRAHGGAELINELGALCWHELLTVDLDRTKSFYNALLGWEYEASASGHTTITNAGSRIATMRARHEQEGATADGWIPYFGVESTQEAAGKAAQNGGRTLTAPTDGPIGRTALLADPHGARFAVLDIGALGQPRRRDATKERR